MYTLGRYPWPSLPLPACPESIQARRPGISRMSWPSRRSMISFGSAFIATIGIVGGLITSGRCGAAI